MSDQRPPTTNKRLFGKRKPPETRAARRLRRSASQAGRGRKTAQAPVVLGKLRFAAAGTIVAAAENRLVGIVSPPIFGGVRSRYFLKGRDGAHRTVHRSSFPARHKERVSQDKRDADESQTTTVSRKHADEPPRHSRSRPPGGAQATPPPPPPSSPATSVV